VVRLHGPPVERRQRHGGEHPADVRKLPPPQQEQADTEKTVEGLAGQGRGRPPLPFGRAGARRWAQLLGAF
jgi:hypothetical protein